MLLSQICPPVRFHSFSLFVCLFQDVDDFFEHEKTFLLEYHNRVKDASAKSDRMIRSHKSKKQLQFITDKAVFVASWETKDPLSVD